MTSHTEYVDRVRRLKRPALLRLWAGIQAGRTPGWPPGMAFEHLVLRAFELDGATVTWPYSVELQGYEVEQIDGAIHLSDLHCLVESKDEAIPAGIEPLAKMRNQLQRRPNGTVGLLLARSGFSQPARLLATYMVPVQILLWTGVYVDVAIRRGGMVAGLRRKYNFAVESGVPNFGLGPE